MTVLYARWRLILIGVMAVAALGATAGYIAAQGITIYEEREGDDRVVAIVEGVEVPYGELRKSPEYWQNARPELTEEEAYLMSIVGNVDRFILLAEVEKRGLMPTVAEGEASMVPHREGCSKQKACKDKIRESGRTFEELWERTAPYFREDLGIIRVRQALLTEAGIPPDEGTSVERAAALSHAVNKLRANADIEWKDEGLADLYRRAIMNRDK